MSAANHGHWPDDVPTEGGIRRRRGGTGERRAPSAASNVAKRTPPKWKISRCASEWGTAQARCWPACAASAPAATMAVVFDRSKVTPTRTSDRPDDDPGQARGPQLAEGATDPDPRREAGHRAREIGEQPRGDDHRGHRQAFAPAQQRHAADGDPQHGQRYQRAVEVEPEPAPHGQLEQPGQHDGAGRRPEQPPRDLRRARHFLTRHRQRPPSWFSLRPWKCAAQKRHQTHPFFQRLPTGSAGARMRVRLLPLWIGLGECREEPRLVGDVVVHEGRIGAPGQSPSNQVRRDSRRRYVQDRATTLCRDDSDNVVKRCAKKCPAAPQNSAPRGRSRVSVLFVGGTTACSGSSPDRFAATS